MLPSQPPKVLIIARELAVGRRWAEQLAPTSATLMLQTPDMAPQVAPGDVEVVLTDLPATEAISPANPQGRRLAELHAAGRLAVIGINGAPGADLSLAAGWTPGELRLACQLAGEIVRMRIAGDKLSLSHQVVVQLAETDFLTGVANRRAWDRRLASRLAAETASQGPWWLAIVDLDRFKEINDRLGYATGDRLLRAAARAMAEQLRRDDLIARIGGDEFGVLLSGISEQQVRGVLERLRMVVARQSSDEPRSRVTASIGFTRGEGHSSAAELLKAAEMRLRAAKHGGGDRIVGKKD
jgi:diguanylate cyclase (GGDEF)-like protein